MWVICINGVWNSGGGGGELVSGVGVGWDWVLVCWM